MGQFKPIPIGVEDFKRLVDDGYYFIDKTLMIQDILDQKGAVKLFTRPRRFGKTLNMSMIQRYFEKTEEDNSYLFEELNISKAGDKYRTYQGQYPVISLSLKSRACERLLPEDHQVRCGVLSEILSGKDGLIFRS